MFLCALLFLAIRVQAERAVIPAIPAGRLVTTNTLSQIYDEMKKLFKYGVVPKGTDTNKLVDCPSIFLNGEH